MKRLALIRCFIAATAVSSLALAQQTGGRNFGRSGQVALSAERLFGITHTSMSKGDMSYTSVSLFGSSGLSVALTPYSVPRLAVDGFVTDGLSLGLGAGFANVTASEHSDSNTIKVFVINPRIGYAIEANSSLTFWPRAGISYVNLDIDTSTHSTAVTLEGQFVVTAQHFGFMFGPIADVGIDGTHSQKVTQIGVEAGLIGWF